VTERLADIDARIEGIRQLGAVVNAMRGIAAARAQQARGQIVAVDSYAATIEDAIARVRALSPPDRADRADGRAMRPVLVLFCAEQGFAGAFSERVLDAIETDIARSELFLIGTRGAGVAAERGVVADWHHAMPSHSGGIPKLAGSIAEALYTRIATGQIDRLDAVFAHWQPGGGTRVERRRLFPLESVGSAPPVEPNMPLLNLPPEAVLSDLAGDYMHAQLCKAGLHAFVAENEARMEAMAAAHSHIERQLVSLQARQRLLRQEEITAEIIELAAGETASVKTTRRKPG